MTKDSIGDRMKNHESRFRFYLPRRAYTIIRLDGKAFHTYTKNLDKENDFEITTYEFENVVMTKDFERFLNDFKDYDVSKSTDWFIVEYGNEKN